MKFTTEDMLKKAIIDTREQVRDYMNYSAKADDEKIKNCFKSFAEVQGKQANTFMQLLNEYHK